MKTFRAFPLAGFLLGCFAGCVSHSDNLVLDPVGPGPASSAPTASAMGTLKVFSAFEASNSITQRFDDLKRHTSYQIFSANGTLVRAVGNRAGNFQEEPETVELPEGSYQVKALANGYGLVTIPVVVSEHRVTSVHLESSPLEGSVTGEKAMVRLPGGPVVGWRAQS